MYTVISATHRPGSNTLKVANIYLQILQDQGIEAKLLSLEDLPHDFIFTDSFGKRTKRFQQIIDDYLVPARKFVLVAPEYNGGMPGIFNAFLDAVQPDPFRGKKVAMVGVASGRGGNSRGMDHQSNCFHYLGVNVYYQFVALSQVLTMENGNGGLDSEVIQNLLKKQILGFMKY
jgi:chromate reductase